VSRRNNPPVEGPRADWKGPVVNKDYAEKVYDGRGVHTGWLDLSRTNEPYEFFVWGFRHGKDRFLWREKAVNEGLPQAPFSLPEWASAQRAERIILVDDQATIFWEISVEDAQEKGELRSTDNGPRYMVSLFHWKKVDPVPAHWKV
jgi:hypothetical protein